jgi:hypothetical protein
MGTIYHLVERCGNQRFTILFSGSAIQMAAALPHFQGITLNRIVELPGGGFTIGDSCFLCIQREEHGRYDYEATDIGDFMVDMLETFTFGGDGWYEAWIGTPGVDARMVWAEFSADDLFNHIVHTDAYEHGWYEYHALPLDDAGEFVESVVKYAWRSTFDFFHFMEPEWYIGYVDNGGDIVFYAAAPDLPEPEYAETAARANDDLIPFP